MRRSLISITLVLLLGAIVNLAVAWTCAFFYNPGAIRVSIPATTQTTPEARAVWDKVFGQCVYADRFDDARDVTGALPSSTYGSVIFQLHELHQTGIGVHHIYLSDMIRPRPPSLTITRAGWPMLAFEAWSIAGQPLRIQPGDHNAIVLRMPLKGGPGSRRIELPYRPIMRGFLINTIVYGSVFWIFARMVALRSHLRRKRGLCVNCGYDLRGTQHQRCPECGCTSSNAATSKCLAPA